MAALPFDAGGLKYTIIRPLLAPAKRSRVGAPGGMALTVVM
jgi:hypothetical protein